MKNNILKIINEKYEKYSIGYRKIKCPKSEHFGMRHSFFGRWPIFFGQNRPSPPPKNGPYAYDINTTKSNNQTASNWLAFRS